MKPIGQEFKDRKIKPALENMSAYCNYDFREADNLIMGTFAQEGRFRYLRQLNMPLDGYTGAFGLGQSEIKPHLDNLELLNKKRNSYSPKLYNYFVVKLLNHDLEGVKFKLLWDIPYQIAACRIHYLLVNRPLPARDDIQGMAEYWKEYYNTKSGKGTPEEFIENYRSYCL